MSDVPLRSDSLSNAQPISADSASGDSADDRNPVELLAEEFIERRRAGEYPSLTEYADRYPEHAEQIRDVFPTMMMMEQMKPQADPSQVELPQPSIEQLGDFRIVREVGRGGMGVVYEAVQESLGRHVALKVLSNRSLHNPKRLQRFNREAQAAAKLHHTNIVPVFGVGDQDGLHYLVMQFINGQGLDKVLAALRCQLRPDEPFPGKYVDSQTLLDPPTSVDAQEASRLARSLMSTVDPLPYLPMVSSAADGSSLSQTADGSAITAGNQQPEESADSPGTSFVRPSPSRGPRAIYWQNIMHLGFQIADALDHAHSHGTFHRDIKPANLLLDDSGTVWIADFGLAKLASGDDLTNSGDIVGTLAYMAPEQFDGRADHRSDLYGLGLTLYELTTLQAAFSDTDRARLIRKVTENAPIPPRKINPRIPRDLETIILKSIAKEPERRYQSARELADDLQAALGDRPIRARRVGPAERLWRWCRRNRALATLSGVTLTMILLAMGFAGIGYLQVRDAYRETALALEGESRQRRTAVEERERAEQVLDIAMLVLDRVFDEAAPRRFSVSLDAGTEDELEPAELEPAVSEQNAALLQSLLQFYDRFSDLDRATASVRLKSGQAYRRVGEIEARLAQYPDAIAAFRKAVGVFQPLVKQYPDDIEYRSELVDAYNGLGNALRHDRQFDEALTAHQNALRLLASRTGVTSEKQRQVAYQEVESLNEIGMAFSMSFRAMEAERYYRRALDRLDELLQLDPSVADYRMAKAGVLSNLSRLMFFTRRSDEGRDNMRTSLQMVEDLVRDYPNVARYTYDLVDRYLAISQRSRSRDIDDEQLVQVEEAMRLAAGLVRRHPDVPEYELLHARSLTAHGRQLMARDQPDQAVPELRQASNRLKSLVYRFPSVSSYYLNLAIASSNLGDALRETGALAEGRVAQEEAIENLHLTLRNEQDNRMAKWMLARQYRELSETLALLGESSLAEESAAQADLMRSQLRRRPETRNNRNENR